MSNFTFLYVNSHFWRHGENGSHFEFASVKFKILDTKNVGNDVLHSHSCLEMTK